MKIRRTELGFRIERIEGETKRGSVGKATIVLTAN